MDELKEFRVVRKVVTTQFVYIWAVDNGDAVAEGIRSYDYEWENEAMPLVINGTEKAIQSPEE